MFESLTRDVAGRAGITEGQASDLLRATTARLLRNEKGGFAALLATIRRDEPELVAAWLSDDPKAGVIAPADVDRFLGADFAPAAAKELAISDDAARQGAAVALPMLVDQLTPGGLIPAASELEASYGGWAGGHVSRVIATDNPPLADFPTEPEDERPIEMDLARPPEPVVAKALDGPITLLPWAILVFGLIFVTLLTARLGPQGPGVEETRAAKEAGEGGGEGRAREGLDERRPGDTPMAGPEAAPGNETKALPGERGPTTP